MNWLTKLERKFGRYAIRNITMYMIACYAVGYILEFANGRVLGYLTLNPAAILLQGQIWRLVTWILIPPEGFNFFTLIMLYFYFSIGTTLERAWGTFRYNVYMLSGVVFTILGAFLFFGMAYLFGANGQAAMELSMTLPELIGNFCYHFSTYYICMSLILAFSATFPEMQVYLFFVLPIKIKVLGIIYALIIGYDFFMSCKGFTIFVMFGGTQNGAGDVYIAMMHLARIFAILFSLLNFLIFFITTRKSFRTPTQLKRQREYKKKMTVVRPVAKHKCAICGRSAEEYPDLEFRFCSKCDGNYEYCRDHLFTHKHVTK